MYVQACLTLFSLETNCVLHNSQATFTCSFCGKDAVKRAAVGIWSCKGCKKDIAGGAYTLGYLDTKPENHIQPHPTQARPMLLFPCLFVVFFDLLPPRSLLSCCFLFGLFSVLCPLPLKAREEKMKAREESEQLSSSVSCLALLSLLSFCPISFFLAPCCPVISSSLLLCSLLPSPLFLFSFSSLTGLCVRVPPSCPNIPCLSSRLRCSSLCLFCFSAVLSTSANGHTEARTQRERRQRHETIHVRTWCMHTTSRPTCTHTPNTHTTTVPLPTQLPDLPSVVSEKWFRHFMSKF